MAANPRAAAVAALVRQEQDGFSNLVLDAELRRQKLEGRDKAFAGAIFYTVLEHQGTLDFILEQFLPKGLARLDPQVREILRAALAQARYMQVTVSAAVNEAVKLTRTFKKASASGLVNAVLRKACNYDVGVGSAACKLRAVNPKVHKHQRCQRFENYRRYVFFHIVRNYKGCVYCKACHYYRRQSHMVPPKKQTVS